MPDLTGEQEQGSRRNRGWRRTSARGLIGMSAIGATAAMVVAAAAGGAPASAGTHSLGHRNALSETTSSSAGNMTIKATYSTGPRGRVKVGSVTYVGDSRKSLKKPVLVFSFAPAFSGPIAVRGTAKVRNRRAFSAVFIVRLKPGELKDFSGSLADRYLRSVNRHGGILGGETLTVSLGNGQFRKVKHGGKQVNFSILGAMQAGMILSPSF